MRVFFMRAGHIVSVEELPNSLTNRPRQRHALFSERKHMYEGFELWDRTRVLTRHPVPSPQNNAAVWPLRR